MPCIFRLFKFLKNKLLQNARKKPLFFASHAFKQYGELFFLCRSFLLCAHPTTMKLIC